MERYKTPENIVNTIRENTSLDSMYIYDLEVMRSKMSILSCLPSKVDTYFAMKVNPHKKVVNEALKHSNIKWIEVASRWEIDIVLSNWEKDLSRVIYTWPSKTSKELDFCIENNIWYLNVESLVEAIRINKKAREIWIVQNILLRLNTKHKFLDWEAWVKLWSWDTQFWVAQDDTIEILKILSKFENIKVDWFHMYPATWIMSAWVLLRSVDETFKFVAEIENKTWKNFRTIDFGWWFWVDYGWFSKFDIQKYSEWLWELIDKYGFWEKTFILELWRYLWADMWYFVTKINDIKKVWKSSKWILCYAWTNAHKRPQVLWIDYHIDVVNIETKDDINYVLKNLWLEEARVCSEDLVNIYWPFCTSVDYLAKWKTWITANIWDYVVMPQSGAYWKSMSPQGFLSHPEVPEIIINE